MFIYLSLSYGYAHDLSSGQNDNESDSVDSDVNSDVAFALATLSAHLSSGFLTLVYNKFVVIPPAVPALLGVGGWLPPTTFALSLSLSLCLLPRLVARVFGGRILSLIAPPAGLG